jgi:replicative DNA helicase
MTTSISDPDAERLVLGACLRDAVARACVRELLLPTDFDEPHRAAVYAAITATEDAGSPVDPVSVRDQLRRNGDEWRGSLEWLETLPASDIVDAARGHAEIVARLATKRRQALTGIAIVRAARDPTTTPDQVVDVAEAQMLEWLAQRSGGASGDLGSVIDRALERIDAAIASGSGIQGLATGFADLDQVLGGLAPGSYTVVAGRPSMGKTAFGLGVAFHNARHGVPVLFVSAEMSDIELAMRVLAAEARMSPTDLRVGRVTDAQRAVVEAARERHARMPLVIEHHAAPTIGQVAAAARRCQRERGLGLVVVDYLQLIGANERQQNNNLEIAEVSKGLKALAVGLDCAVVALSGLNRGPERREDKRPQVADLRDSGQIEADADVALMLYRDAHYHPETSNPLDAEVIVVKSRNGPTGTVYLAWIATSARFVNLGHLPAVEHHFPGATIEGDPP